MDKLDLENALYARARLLGAPVWARGGVLITPCKDGALRALLAAYEAFFGAENRERIKRTLAEERREAAAFADAFDRERSRLGPCAVAEPARRPWPAHGRRDCAFDEPFL